MNMKIRTTFVVLAILGLSGMPVAAEENTGTDMIKTGKTGETANEKRYSEGLTLIYRDNQMAFYYPSDFTLDSSAEGDVLLVNGTMSMAIAVTDEETWETGKALKTQAVQGDQTLAALDRPDIKAKTAMSEYTDFGFTGSLFTLEVLLDAERHLGVFDLDLYARRAGHYFTITVSDEQELLHELLVTVVGSVAFPGEAEYEALKKKKR